MANSQFLEHLDLGLDEGSTFGIVAELVYKLLDMGTKLHLGIIFSLLVLLSLILGLKEVLIVSSVGEKELHKERIHKGYS